MLQPSVRWDSFFFFQAEDGIRDGHVTGVQTCAPDLVGNRTGMAPGKTPLEVELKLEEVVPPGSEERRVGKECRSRWWPYHLKRNRHMYCGVHCLINSCYQNTNEITRIWR